MVGRVFFFWTCAVVEAEKELKERSLYNAKSSGVVVDVVFGFGYGLRGTFLSLSYYSDRITCSWPLVMLIAC